MATEYYFDASDSVSIDPDTTQLINGASTYSLTARWQTVKLQLVNGSGWIVTGKN